MSDTRGCAGKKRYPTGPRARQALQGVRKRGLRDENGKPQRPYPCDHCNGWHLTGEQDPPARILRQRPHRRRPRPRPGDL